MSSSGWTGFSDKDAETFARQRAAQVRYFVAGLALLAASALLWPVLGRGLANLQFMPHVFCYLGNQTLISVNLVSDLLIGVSYVVISLTLLYMVRASKGGIPFHWMFLAFGTFIIACGATHFMEAITLWHPVYWISAYVKVVTALASVATAIALPLVVPRLLSGMATLREAEERSMQLERANAELSSANEKLQESDRLRRRFVARAAASVGDWEWDIPGGRVQWSPEVEDMHGFARGAFPGTLEAWKTTVHPEDLARAEANITASFQNKSEYDIEYRTLRPDGSMYWIAGRGTVECGPAGMCMDITGRKRTEEALRKTEKLAAAGRLAATIAHEINNPLEAVTNLLYLARAEPSQDSCRVLIDMAERELQRVGHITRQTLGFYRQAGAPVLFELGDLLKSVVDVFQGKLNSRAISVIVQMDGPVHLYGAPGELRQVLANLLSNAIDASPAKAEITIRVKGTGEGARVTIADRGAGIPEESRA